MEFDANNGTPNGQQSLSIEGGFTWSTDDGRAGSCAVDILGTRTFQSDGSGGGTITQNINGTVCGKEFDSFAQLNWPGQSGA